MLFRYIKAIVVGSLFPWENPIHRLQNSTVSVLSVTQAQRTMRSTNPAFINMFVLGQRANMPWISVHISILSFILRNGGVVWEVASSGGLSWRVSPFLNLATWLPRITEWNINELNDGFSHGRHVWLPVTTYGLSWHHGTTLRRQAELVPDSEGRGGS